MADWRARIEGKGLALLLLWTAAAAVGFATFGRHPEMLAARPEAFGFYRASFGIFAQVHVWLGGVILIFALSARAGVRWLPAFVVVYAVSLASELAGTTWGLPFGLYTYSRVLEPMWFERVPILIPLSWFVMALSSFVLARRWTRGRLATVMLGSLVLLAWDLALDPAMSSATRYWVWAEEGPYYGMPLSNLFGWYVTGIALLYAMSALRIERWVDLVPHHVFVMLYALNVLLPLAMLVAAGFWGAIATTLLTLIAIRLIAHVSTDEAWRMRWLTAKQAAR